MEEQIISVKIVTKGEKCEMTDEEIIKWYEKNISSLFDRRYGTPEISVDLKRREY